MTNERGALLGTFLGSTNKRRDKLRFGITSTCGIIG
jgi:hypothetical protein